MKSEEIFRVLSALFLAFILNFVDYTFSILNNRRYLGYSKLITGLDIVGIWSLIFYAFAIYFVLKYTFKDFKDRSKISDKPIKIIPRRKI